MGAWYHRGAARCWHCTWALAQVQEQARRPHCALVQPQPGLPGPANRESTCCTVSAVPGMLQATLDALQRRWGSRFWLVVCFACPLPLLQTEASVWALNGRIYHHAGHPKWLLGQALSVSRSGGGCLAPATSPLPASKNRGTTCLRVGSRASAGCVCPQVR